MDDAIRQLLDVGEPIVVRFRHELLPYQQRLLAALGAGYVVDEAAPPCVRACGHEECTVTTRAVGALPLGMASLGLGRTDEAREPDWIGFRSSVANVERRRDKGEIPEVCDACGCEVDVTPAPHSPKCPTLARPSWTRAAMLTAVAGWAAAHDGAPFASDWPGETEAHPSAREVVKEFGTWSDFLQEANLEPRPRYSPRRRSEPATDGLDLLERMDAGEPVGLEETAAVGKRAESGAAPLLVGEPERAAVSSNPDPEADLEEAPESGGDRSGVSSSPEPGRRRASKWTREKVVAAIREVAEQVGHTPTGNDMRAAGLGGAYQVSTFERLGTSWQELVREAGYEPRVRGSNTTVENGSPQAASVDLGRAASWTEDEVLDAIRRWAADHGQPPTSDDWTPRVDGYPSAATAARRFGSWAEAVERAGYDRPARGGHTRQPVTAPVRRVRVRGTGLTYRSPAEAYVAADEIEADGERVADQARFDGNETKAEHATDQSRELAEKIRAAAAAFEERGDGARSGREPEAEPAVAPQSDHSLQAASARPDQTPAPPSRPDATPPPVDEVGLVPVADLHERSDAWITALHAEAERLDRRAAAFRKIADGLGELQQTNRPEEVLT